MCKLSASEEIYYYGIEEQLILVVSYFYLNFTFHSHLLFGNRCMFVRLRRCSLLCCYCHCQIYLQFHFL